MTSRLFGTDGVRGIANSRELSPELAYRLGLAAARVLIRHESHGHDKGSRPALVVGRDPRVSGHLLEAALTAGAMAAGVDVFRLGVVTTPAVAFLVKQLGAQAGAMISASHNPAEYNGIKFFSVDGYKLPDAVEDEIEALVKSRPETLPHPTGAGVGRTFDRPEVIELYIQHLIRTVRVNFNGLRLVVDCANGSAAAIAPEVYRRLGAEVISIFDQPDGININDGCGSTHPERLLRETAGRGAQAGLAHDGDADRVLLASEKGELVDGDQILAICGRHRLRQGTLRGQTVAATVLSNLGLEQCLKGCGGRVVKTAVGDRYVLEEMLKRGLTLGGEQSGHVIFLEHSTTGDGILTALQVLAVMVETGQTLSELAGQMPRFPQVMVNVQVSDKTGLLTNPAIIGAVRKAEGVLGDLGRILVRPSGTEPLVRVMVEGPERETLTSLADEVAGVIRAELGGAG